MKWWPVSPRPGDMVRVHVSGVWHYGIYISDDRVIQFGCPPRGDAVPAQDIRVVATSAAEFAGRDIIETAQLSFIERLRRLSPEKTIIAAESSLGEGGYDLINNNCEHFAYRCVFGKKRSRQGEKALADAEIAPQLWLSPLPESLDEGAYGTLLPPARREYVLDAGNPRLRLRRAWDWLALKSLVKAASGLNLDDINAHRLENGKWVADGIEFSLSHSDNWVAVAVSGTPIGVDIEEITDKRLSSIVRAKGHMLSCGESAEDALELLALWTRKESLYKQGGKGAFDPRAIPAKGEGAFSFVCPDGIMLSLACEKLPSRMLLWDGTRLKSLDAERFEFKNVEGTC